MAVFSGNIRPAILGMDTGLQVILPYDRPAERQQTPCKVLYLFHGLGEDSTAWCRYSRIEHYARQRGIAVIMPDVQRSFYTDMHHGMRYFTYVSEELPQLCAQMFQLSRRPEDTFVAGLSMGGYGALRCAFHFPHRYAAVASFSGAVDFKDVAESFRDRDINNEFPAVLGHTLEVPAEEDLFLLAERAAATSHPPGVFMTCGEQDYLLEMNRRLSDHLTPLLPRFRFETWEGGHEWSFWDKSIQKALDFFLGGQ